MSESSTTPESSSGARPADLRRAAIRVVERLQSAGHETYFAGGCVRDLLLGQEPKDFDIATSARPKEVRGLFDRSGFVGAHFGVTLVNEPEGPFEVATFRTDGVYLDGRRPMDVRFSNAEEDARRRDFTINGLFQNPVTGEVIDFVGGRADLEARVIRAIGDPRERFREDHLRLLRAVRFATTLGFEIEPATLTAIQRASPEIQKISAERIQDELSKILVHPKRLKGFDLLVGTALMAEIIPEIMELCGVEQPPDHHPEGDVFVHTRLMFSLLPDREVALTLALAVLFHDIAKPATFRVDPETNRIRFIGHDKAGAEMTGEILRRLKFSNEIVDTTVEAVARHLDFFQVKNMRVSTLKRMLARPNFEEELELHRLDSLGGSKDLSFYEFVREKQTQFRAEPLIPERLISGKDLLERGWQAGPGLGEILQAVQDEQLEGHLGDREAALAWVEQTFPKKA